MKRMVIMLLALTMGAKGFAQGINFDDESGWEQVKAKAKAQNKYIFLDCMATWCGPCRAMENDVYNKKNVGDALNPGFISVRVQLDRTPADNAYVKSWYNDAAALQQQYKVTMMPTYLILSPKAELVLVSGGLMDRSTFLETFKKDKVDSTYYRECLARTEEPAKLTRNDLVLIQKYMRIADKQVFGLFYGQPAAINTLAESKDYAQTTVSDLVKKEVIFDALAKDGDLKKSTVKLPDWAGFAKTMGQKYPAVDKDRIILFAKKDWFSAREQWNDLGAAYFAIWDKYGMPDPKAEMHAYSDSFMLNNIFWFGFALHVDDRKLLKRAAEVMAVLVKYHPKDVASIDTYANLLYKTGNKKDGLTWEKKAVELVPDSKDITANYSNMQKGLPNW